MIIIGISGPIGSGKTTLASMIAAVNPAHSVHMETSALVVEVANAFNAALAPRSAGLTKDATAAVNTALSEITSWVSALAQKDVSIDDIAVKNSEVSKNPEFYSKLFEYCQQAVANPALLHATITPENKSDYRALLQWLGGYILYILDDRLLWYKELKRRIEALSQTITCVALTAPRQPAEADYVRQIGGIVIVIDREVMPSDRSDVTERHVAEIIPDIRVKNNGTLTDLQRCARQILHDLESGETKALYVAKSSAV